MATTTMNPGEATRNFATSMQAALENPAITQTNENTTTEVAAEHGADKPPVQQPDLKKDATPIESVQAKPAVEQPEAEKWPRTAQDWKKFIAARDEGYKKRDEQIKEYEKKVTELSAKANTTPAQDPQFESIKKERDQYNEILRQIAVEKHPKFTEYYTGKEKSQIELARGIVGKDRADAVEQLLNLPDSTYKDEQIEAMVADLPVWKQGQVGQVISALSQLKAEKMGEITKSQQNFERIQAENVSKAEAQKKAIETAFSNQVETLKKDHFLFQSREKDDAWNKGVNDRVEYARSLLLGTPKPEQVLSALFDAVSYPAILKSHEEALKEIETLRTQVTELTKATPRVDGERKAETTTQPTQMPLTSSMRPMDAAAAWVKNLPQLGQPG